MNTMRTLCRAVLSGMLAVGVLWAAPSGCDKKEDTPKQPAPKPPPPDVQPKAQADATSAKASTRPSTRPTTGPAPTDAELAALRRDASAAADTDKQAQDLLAGAIKSINDKQLADARASLVKVESMKDSISVATREKLKTVRGTLEGVENDQRVEVPVTVEPENK